MVEQKYITEITEIRQMMERSTRFLSLTGGSGIMAGIYALIGALVAYWLLDFNSWAATDHAIGSRQFTVSDLNVILVALAVLFLAVGTALLLSIRKANNRNEVLWNATARRLLINMAIPLVSGGILLIILISKGMLSLAAPLTLIFYGLSLVNGSKFTFDDIKYLGLTQIILGLLAMVYINYSLFFWAAGFGLFHIVYGIYMHWRYER